MKCNECKRTLYNIYSRHYDTMKKIYGWKYCKSCDILVVNESDIRVCRECGKEIAKKDDNPWDARGFCSQKCLIQFHIE